MIDTVESLFSGPGGRRYLGERISNAAHMLQAAAAATRSGASPELVAAALLHDVGYLLADDIGPDTDVGHPEQGASWLATWLPPAVSEPVRLHVEAKRYLCATEPGYPLSPASARTLALQGGPMTAAEAAAFAAHPYGPDAVRVRRFDDDGKVPAAQVPAIHAYRDLLAALRSR